MTRVVRGAVLVSIWLALWSDVTVANVLSGAVVATVVVAAFGGSPRGTAVVRPVRLARFAGFFLVKLVQSSATVARTVVRPAGRVDSGIIAVPLTGCSEVVATVIADAISLTPGTLTLEVSTEPLALFVHTLDVRRIEQVRADVARLEVLAVRAFGDADALAGLAERAERPVTGSGS